jgi:tetratricopeptide (TPR) repeat protein
MGRSAVVLLLGLSLAACSQFGGLKAKKHFKDANALYQQQDYRKAAAEYAEAIKADPELRQAYFFLGNSYDLLYKPARKGEAVNDGYLQDAIKNYQLSIDKLAGSTDPTDKELRKRSFQYLAAVYAADKLNDPDKAEPVVKQLIDMDPNDTSNYMGLSRIYEDAGRFEEAEAAIKRAETVAANDPSVAGQIAEFYNRRGNFEQAMVYYEKVTQLEPTNPQHFNNVALRYEEKVRKDYTIKPAVALEYLRKGLLASDKALEIRPDYFEALTFKNLLLLQQARLEKNPARQKELMDQAAKLRAKAIEIQNLKAKGVGTE